MQERRKQNRKNLSAYSQVYDLEEGNFLGYLGDLTPSGAMIIGEKCMEIEREVTLQLIVPALEGHAARRLSIPARVAWCEPDVSPQFHNIGFEFKEVSDEQRRTLEAIMQAYEFHHEDLPQYPYRPASHR
jgi:Tfp pilus assembly protein PilZ